MTDQLRQAAQQALDFLMTRRMGAEAVIDSLNTALEQQQAEPPPEWESIKNILDEYGLDAIAFVAAWKAVQQRAEPVAQRPWVGLTEDEFLEACQLAEHGNYLVAFQRIQTKLKERNT